VIPQGVQVALGLDDGPFPILRRRPGDEFFDEVHGPLMEHAGRLAGLRVALDAAIGRVRRAGVDPGEFERPGVDPRAVPITVPEVDRPIQDHRIQRFAARQPAGECARPPAAAEDPRLVGVGLRVLVDQADVLRRVEGPIQVTPQLLQAAARRVHMRILEAGEYQTVRDPDDLSA
jgi:hypothetical protein